MNMDTKKKMVFCHRKEFNCTNARKRGSKMDSIGSFVYLKSFGFCEIMKL